MDLDNVEELHRAKVTCERCQKIYQNQICFYKHRCNVCEKCNKIFSSSQRLQSHLDFCLQDNTCKFCKKVLYSQKKLKNHVCTFCLTCKRQYASGQRFRLHKCYVEAEKKKLNLVKIDRKTVSKNIIYIFFIYLFYLSI